MSSQRAYNLHGYSYSSAVLPCNHQPLTRERMAGGDIWVQWFTCCVTQQPPPVSEILLEIIYLCGYICNILLFIFIPQSGGEDHQLIVP